MGFFTLIHFIAAGFFNFEMVATSVYSDSNVFAETNKQIADNFGRDINFV